MGASKSREIKRDECGNQLCLAAIYEPHFMRSGKMLGKRTSGWKLHWGCMTRAWPI